MKLIRILVAVAIVVLVPVVTASAAGATIVGPCTASGTIKDKTYDATRASVKIPRKGDVDWKGAVNAGGSGERNIEGKGYLKLPPPFGKGVFAQAAWSGPPSSYPNHGTHHSD